MKKFVGLIVGLCLVISLIGCSEKNDKDLLQKIKDKGELVIGTSPDYPPFEFINLVDGKDEVAGFEIEIAKLIAKELGVELKIKQMSFDGIISAVKSGQVDIGMSGFTANKERKKSVDFSMNFYKEGQTFMVRKEDANKYTTPKDLKDKKIGAQIGSVQYDIAETIETNALKGLNDLGPLILDLKSGNIDALIISKATAVAFAKENDDLVVADYEFSLDEEGTAVAIPKGNEALTKEINKVISELIDQNKIEEMYNEALKLAENNK